MFAQAQTVEWLEAVESIVDVLSRRISTCRAKHIDQEPGKVVPRMAQILKRCWDTAASVTVVELVRVCGDFKVVKPSKIQDSLPQRPAHAQHATQMQGNQTLFALLNQSCSGVPGAFGKLCSTCVGMVVLSSGSGRKRISAVSSRIWCIPTTNLSAYNRRT